MSLKKLFIISAAIAALIIGLVNTGLAFYLGNQSEASNREMAEQLAEATSRGVALKLDAIAREVDQLAATPWIINRMTSGKQELLDLGMGDERVCQHVRLIPPRFQETIDDTYAPLGFADLELINRAKQRKPDLALHGLGGNKERYVAVARSIKQGRNGIGVLFAYCESAWLSTLLTQGQKDLVAMSLRQDDIVLASSAGGVNPQNVKVQEIRIPSSSWRLQYALTDEGNNFAYLLLITSLIMLVMWVVMLLAVHTYLSKSLLHDLNSLLSIAADLFRGKTQGAYPVVFNEFSETISQIALLKRTPPQREKSLSGMSRRGPVTDSQMGELETLDFSLDGGQLQAEPVPEILFADQFIESREDYSLGAEQILQIGRAFASEVMESGVSTTVVIGYEGAAAGALVPYMQQGLRGIGCDVMTLNETRLPQLESVLIESRNAVFINQPQEGHTRIMLWLNQKLLQGAELKAIYQRIRDARFYSE